MAEGEKKQELAEALRKALNKKPLNRITVTEIAEACHMNRQSFYYHFKDVYFLAEYLYKSDLANMVSLKENDGADWQELFGKVFGYAGQNRTMILNTIFAIDRDVLETNLYSEIADLLLVVIKGREKATGVTITEKDERIIADFYKYPIVGVAFEWMSGGMVYDPTEKVTNVCLLMSSNLDQNIALLKSVEIKADSQLAATNPAHK